MGARPISQKLYYRIGEVADIAGVKPHVLRYWETEFGFLSPEKNEGNQRLYTQQDLQKVLTIKKLLYQDRFTIAGAKRRFREEWRTVRAGEAGTDGAGALRQVRRELQEILRLLARG
ncbi:MAG: MerR family transcriptional regulator [Deferrisomatales bacterium]|nr:MerR family transcriptional regulator [Deferrisomatales bacterium]